MTVKKRESGNEITMGDIAHTKYIKKNITKEWLLSNGFRYNRLLSDDKIETYTYRFPVHKYNKFTVLECELRVLLGEDNILINVYDYATNDKYAPFYYCEYGDYDKMLKIINEKISRELKRLGIIYKNN